MLLRILSRWRLLTLLAIIALGGVALRLFSPWRPADPYEARVYELVAPYRFQLARWEVQAVWAEAQERIRVRTVDIESLSARTLVLDYLEVGREIGALKGEVERLVAEDREGNRERVAQLQARLQTLRALQEARRPVV